MDVVLQDLLGTDWYIYLDDLIVYSNTIEENAQKLGRVFERFERADLQLHHGKCTIAQPRIKYLGYTLSEQDVAAAPDKIEAVKNCPVPRNARDVRAFLGLAFFYRRLVFQFEETAKPLTQLTKKNQAFAWGVAQQEAFEALKSKLYRTTSGLPKLQSSMHIDDRCVQSGGGSHFVACSGQHREASGVCQPPT
jgi:hypothetical protein